MTVTLVHPSWPLDPQTLDPVRAQVREACAGTTDETFGTNAEGALTPGQHRDLTARDESSRWGRAGGFGALAGLGALVAGMGAAGGSEVVVGTGGAFAGLAGWVFGTLGWRHHRFLHEADLPVRALRGRVRVRDDRNRIPTVTVDGLAVPIPAAAAGLPVIVHHVGRQVISGDVDLSALSRPSEQTRDEPVLDGVRDGVRGAVGRPTPDMLAANAEGVLAAQQRIDLLREERVAIAAAGAFGWTILGVAIALAPVDLASSGMWAFGGLAFTLPLLAALPGRSRRLLERPVQVVRGRIRVTGTGNDRQVTVEGITLPEGARHWPGTPIVAYHQRGEALAADVDEVAYRARTPSP